MHVNVINNHFNYMNYRYKEFEINAINTTWDLELNKVGKGFKNKDEYNIWKKVLKI